MTLRQKGFTLIEMLVAMAIFSTLIGTLMLGYRQGLLMWEKSQKQSDKWLTYELRHRLLSTLFAQAVVSDNEVAEDVFAVYFKGEAQSMRLVTSAAVLDMPGRVRPVELQAVEGVDDRWQIRYREAPRYNDVGRGINWPNTWVTLLDDLSSVSFSYLAPAFPLPEDLDPRWLAEKEKKRFRDQPEWLAAYDGDFLWLFPLQVAIRFTDGGGEEHYWLFNPPTAADAWSMSAYETE